jgi:hypothetical protein
MQKAQVAIMQLHHAGIRRHSGMQFLLSASMLSLHYNDLAVTVNRDHGVAMREYRFNCAASKCLTKESFFKIRENSLL